MQKQLSSSIERTIVIEWTFGIKDKGLQWPKHDGLWVILIRLIGNITKEGIKHFYWFFFANMKIKVTTKTN